MVIKKEKKAKQKEENERDSLREATKQVGSKVKSIMCLIYSF